MPPSGNPQQIRQLRPGRTTPVGLGDKGRFAPMHTRWPAVATKRRRVEKLRKHRVKSIGIIDNQSWEQGIKGSHAPRVR